MLSGFWSETIIMSVATRFVSGLECNRCLPPLTNTLVDYQQQEIRWMLKNQGLI